MLDASSSYVFLYLPANFHGGSLYPSSLSAAVVLAFIVHDAVVVQTSVRSCRSSHPSDLSPIDVFSQQISIHRFFHRDLIQKISIGALFSHPRLHRIALWIRTLRTRTKGLSLQS